MHTFKPELPSKLPLALNIGFTGHRPDGLQEADANQLKQQITAVFTSLSSVTADLLETHSAQTRYNQTKPVLRLLSSLAEGADRIAAECALAADFKLQCPLPFERQSYTLTFKDQTTNETFFNLLERAERIFELDGNIETDKMAYRHVGRLVVHHADIMLAVWDGKIDETSVGTAGVIAETQQQGIPIIWINSKTPHVIVCWDSGSAKDDWRPLDVNWLNTILKQLLFPADSEPVTKRWHNCLTKLLPKQQKNTYSDFYWLGEPNRFGIGLAYRAFFSFLGKRSIHFWGNPYKKDTDYQWQAIIQATDHLTNKVKLINTLNEQIRDNFIRADSLATYFADNFRGTFVLCFFLSACSVAFATLGTPINHLPAAFEDFSLLELAALFFVLMLVYRSRLRQTHQHWLDYRLLAERLRQQAIMLPMGSTSRWTLPDYEGQDDSSHAWINRFMHSVSRAEGLPDACQNSEYRQGYCLYLAALLTDQAQYHESNAKRNKNIVQFFEIGNTLLLILVILACSLHIYIERFLAEAEFIPLVATILAIVLPAFGAAFAGISSQGEFERIQHRSEGMKTQLANLAEKLKTKAPIISSHELNQYVNQASDILSSELSDWRVLFRKKTLRVEA